MKIFTLPDLGEGLPDAVVREWHVSEGSSVAAHESLVTVETAKALVEVPAPWGGKVEKLFAEVDETVNVGDPLVGFTGTGEGEVEAQPGPGANEVVPEPVQATAEEHAQEDSGTVVGSLEQGEAVLEAEPQQEQGPRRFATPSVRALARRLGVDLQRLSKDGARVTAAQVCAAAGSRPQTPAETAVKPVAASEAAAMSPARRAMGLSMSRARDQVAQITLCDDADISNWWGSAPALLRLIRALQAACIAEPNLNALYRDDQLIPQATINIGLAVDSPRGLFVPVLRDVAAHSDEALLQAVADFKQQARETGIAQSDLQGGSILLSNFGAIAGRYATPLVLPPTVAIVGAGRVCQGVVVVDRWPAMRPLLPLSVSADHRAVTGGELARFLQALLQALSS
ncbi:dihydrolipoamide acetyltransferase family protein [Microbulbifer sp. 2205BS26-8]|uniref:dihydrolipoamide acetyltransferase family protein n=1 Tax=Microbulbifer sp. 2205BS26-8 TaxID=3064386 RepID=UPI00273FBA88|nr:dihydrolipoamide acetyltransferase family protein [Microbulbifer sp. 2205BS26-8]MDP5210494.1 dihydrolipoamide acetyltransferase family protein [Microbulbifer sp. 2205BS26-8]